MKLSRILDFIAFGCVLLCAASSFCFSFTQPSSQIQYARERYGYGDMFFVDSQHGWLVGGEDGETVLWRTRDGGENWVREDPGLNIRQLFFLDAHSGWATVIDSSSDDALQTSLYKTPDGGHTWLRCATVIASQPGSPDLIIDFLFVDSQHGWFVGQGGNGNGLFLSTDDGGKSIKQITSLSGNGHSFGITAVGKSKLWIFGNNTILASFDEGKTWLTQLDSDHRIDGRFRFLLHSGVMLANGHGWAVGDGAILATDNFGKSWRIAAETDSPSFFTDVSFWQDSGCAVGSSRVLYCTHDGGKTWHGKEVLPRAELNGHDLFQKFLFSSTTRCWAIDQGGFLFRSDDGGSTWHKTNISDMTAVRKH